MAAVEAIRPASVAATQAGLEMAAEKSDVNGAAGNRGESYTDEEDRAKVLKHSMLVPSEFH